MESFSKISDVDQRHYCEANENLPGAIQIVLTPEDQASLASGVKDIINDWDTFFKKNHRGYSTYSVTIGEHNKTEQKQNTRRVGPSLANFTLFRNQYSWFGPLVEVVKAFVLSHATQPFELHDVHILRQVSAGIPGGSAAFSDHQDRHGEETHEKLLWTYTLLAHSTGPKTDFFAWRL